MAKDTLRDRVWHTALEFSTEAGRPEPISEIMSPDGFTKRQVKTAVDASDRTVHDVLKTMVDYGYLEEEEQYIAVPQGDSQANHDTTVYSAASPEQPQGKNAQDGDEQVSDTAEPGESGIDDDLSEDTREVAQKIASQNGLASLKASQADDEQIPGTAGTTSNESVIEPASKTHDIDQLPFDKYYERISDLPNVSRKRRLSLVTSGFKSFNDIYVASVNELTKVDGIGTSTAQKIKISLADTIRQNRDIPHQDIANESIEYIIDEYNLDDQSAEEWRDHAQAKASQDGDDEQISDTAEEEEDLPFESNAGGVNTFQKALPGVGEGLASKLVSHGFESFNDLYLASIEEIAETDAFGTKRVQDVKIYIADMVRKRKRRENVEIVSESAERIAQGYNITEEAAKQWQSHIEAAEIDLRPDATDFEKQERDMRLLSYLSDDFDDMHITHYPGNEA